ncbi:MAG TPA: AMP-binding protein [Nocardioides sp.]|nr:AMP-binding protein [Nocardioides sp.]
MSLLLPSPERAPARPVFDLPRYGPRTALHTGAGEISFAELSDRAADLARDVLGPCRRLVLIEGANTPEAVTAYLAALQHGHVALLVPEGRPAQLHQMIEAYDPDVVLRHEDDRWLADPRRRGSTHDLHPDLALLLSTSGSTGSPKLVRLSHDNLRSNAASIASYLRITPDDRAATSLPLHYCYGLSVVNSHLLTGAGLVLTEGSVVDECFWRRFEGAGATSFAGVPYTFDLLEHSGFADRDLPSLRYVTQAGGRLGPDRVRAWAELGQRRGWDFVVMYGQTEATARMAYLPAELATSRPETIGVAIPGGSLRLEPVAEATTPGVGELVYEGPNVMLGYADSPADLAEGRTVDALRTGDLARISDGLVEIVGRRGRQAKVFGLRLDLDRIETTLAARVPRAEVRCLAVGDTLHAFTTRRRSSARLHAELTELCGLPRSAVRVHTVAELPRTGAGKPDHAALEQQARLADDSHDAVTGPAPAVTASSLRDEFALVLGRPDAEVSDSFVSLGGDSLSYVELATRLGRRLDRLPPAWHTRTIAELAAPAPTAARPCRRRLGRHMDTTVVLRALCILLIVGSHANVLTVVGGAHLLLAVAGYNFARFQLADVPRAVRIRNGLVAIAQVVVPSSLYISAVALITGDYDLPTAFFLNGLLGSDGWTLDWQFWFLEALVWTSLGAVALTAVPALDRVERRAQFAFPVVLVLGTVALRFAWTGIEAGPTERYTTGVVLWCFALGWAAARSRTAWQRIAVLVMAVLAYVGFFGDLQRELLIVTGIAVLLWVPTLRLPRMLAPVITVLAGASLFVYLTHWQVYPHLETNHPLLALLSSLVVGVAYWWVTRPVLRHLGAWLRRVPIADRSGQPRGAERLRVTGKRSPATSTS